MKTIQRLNNYQSLMVHDVYTNSPIALSDTIANCGWYISSGNGSFIVSGDNYFASSHYVLKINPTNRQPLTIRLDFSVSTIPFTEADINKNFVFTCVTNCTNGNPRINALLCNSETGCTGGNSRNLIGGIWDAVRSNTIKIDNLNYFSIEITFTDHSAETGNLSTIYLSTPNLVNDDAWVANPVIRSIRPYIPGLYQTYDANESDPDWPFFRLVDVLSDPIADTMFTYAAWFQSENSEIPVHSSSSDAQTRSKLTDYRHVRDEYVPWLAQFSGRQVTKQLYDSDGNEIVSDTQDFQTKQLYPAIYGRGAGTQDSLRIATEFCLTGNKEVVISQRYNSNPWNIRITTLGSETTDVDYRGTVVAASTANVDISNDLENGDLIDGIVLSAGDKVLLKNQTTASQNGIYVVSSSGAASRDSSFDTGWNGSTGEITYGATFYVTQGDTNGDKSFSVSTTGNITVGSTAINFEDFPGSQNVLQLVEESRPMGYKIYHTIVDKFALTLGDGTFGVIGTATL